MTPELRITVLMENTAREGLEAEHGLSFFLELSLIHISEPTRH